MSWCCVPFFSLNKKEEKYKHTPILYWVIINCLWKITAWGEICHPGNVLECYLKIIKSFSYLKHFSEIISLNQALDVLLSTGLVMAFWSRLYCPWQKDISVYTAGYLTDPVIIAFLTAFHLWQPIDICQQQLNFENNIHF